MFLPTLPIFFAGLRLNANVAMRAVTVAAILILVVISPSSSVIYMFLLGLPAWYITKGCLTSYSLADGTFKIWYSVGLIITNLAFYAVILCGLLSLYYAGTPGGLKSLLAQQILAGSKELEDEYAQAMNVLAHDWAFLIYPFTVWLWAISLYGHAWLANKLLRKRGHARRPHLVVNPFLMPGWVLYLLCICALASLIGSPNMRFFGESSFIVMLLPYFFLGIAVMHRQSAAWPSRRFFLFFVYFSIFTQVWPALVLAGAGLWHQLKTLNKHLPRSGSSSNN